MVNINLNTAEIREASQILGAKREEIEQAVKDFDARIERCRGTGSPRLNRDVEAWENTKRQLNALLPSLTDTAQALLRAAELNEEANR